MTLEEQLAEYDRLAALSYERALQESVEERKAIIAEGRRRLMAGEPLYGDEGWHWTPAKLKREKRQEKADDVVYGVFLLRQLGL